jgi:hypothetical protein
MVFPLQPRVIASWIFVLTAFIISILLLLAGTKPGFLANAALLIVSHIFNLHFLQCSIQSQLTNFCPIVLPR